MNSWERSKLVDKINKLIAEGYPTDKSPVKDMIEEVENADARELYWQRRNEEMCYD